MMRVTHAIASNTPSNVESAPERRSAGRERRLINGLYENARLEGRRGGGQKANEIMLGD